MKKILALAALAALSYQPAPSVFAASDAPFGREKGIDGYTFAATNDPRPTVIVTYRVYPDFKALRAAAKEAGIGNVPQVGAFSTQNGNVCVIHSIDPKRDYRPDLIGHEYLHCVYGQWHNDNRNNGAGNF